MSSDSHPLEPLYVAYLRKVVAWGFPKIPLSIFETLSQIGYARFGSTDPTETSNPFSLDLVTTQADVDAAFQELESLRRSNEPDFVKWLWLEKCQLNAVDFATCMWATEDEIIQAINCFVTPLSDTQKDLALQWSLEFLTEIDNETVEELDLTDEQYEKLIAAIMKNIHDKKDNESRTRLRVSIEVEKKLGKIFRRRT